MASNQLIDLSSADGAKLLSDVQTGHYGNCCQSKLINIFKKQMSYRSCGIVSCALVLSANSWNESLSSSPAYTEQNMFSKPATLSVITQQKMDTHGNNYYIVNI